MDKNYLSLETFQKAFEPLLYGDRKYMKMNFKLTSEILGDSDKNIKCWSYITDQDIKRLRESTQGWIAPACWCQ